MSILAKVFVIVNLIFSIAYLSVSGTLYHHRQDWRAAFNDVVRDYRALKLEDDTVITALENKLKETNENVTALENQVGNLLNSLEDVGQKYRNTMTDLAIETQEMALLLTDHSRVVMILQEREGTIRQLTQERDYFQRKFQQIKAQKNTAENQVARLTRMLMDTRRDLSDLRKDYVSARKNLNNKKLILQKLRDFGIPVEKICLLQPPPAIDAEVVAYDEPTRLVLLSVGRQDEVEEGHEFTIYRGQRFIGRVKVEKVLPDLCGARVIFEVAKIQKGDRAATRLH